MSDSECRGHALTTTGAAGSTIYCDGRCRRGQTAPVLVIVPALSVGADEPRWWCGSAPDRDEERLQAVACGAYQLSTVIPLDVFARTCGGLDVTTMRAIVRR